MTFPGHQDQVANARHFVMFVMDVLGRCPVLDEAVLLTSELVTNALNHTRSGKGGMVKVALYRDGRSVQIEVTDDGGITEPTVRARDEFSEFGRGLELVQMIARSWGTRGDASGRVVWAVLNWLSEDGMVTAV
jgi:hypothetical protein